MLRHRLPGGPVHRVPRGDGHPSPRLAPVPGPHGAASPAARHYLRGPAGGPRRQRGGGRHEVPPEPVGYTALAAGGKQQQLTKLNFAVTGFGNCWNTEAYLSKSRLSPNAPQQIWDRRHPKRAAGGGRLFPFQ